MSNYNYENLIELPSGEETKRRIARRLKFSRWFMKAMFAVGLASGMVAADASVEKVAPSDIAAGLAAVSASMAAMAERHQARRKVSLMMSGFAEAYSASPSGCIVTSLFLSEGQFVDGLSVDVRAQDFTTQADITYGAGLPLLGGLGVGLILKQIFSEGTNDVGEIILYTFGSGMLGLSAYYLIADHKTINKRIKIYSRRIDNIENPLRFE